MTVYYPDLEQVLNHYGADLPFSYSGHGFEKMRCPFSGHDDGNPSATVNLAIGRVNCFGCGMAGTGLDLIMDWEKCTLVEAIEFARQNFAEAAGGGGRGGDAGKSRRGVRDGSAGPRSGGRREAAARVRPRYRTRFD